MLVVKRWNQLSACRSKTRGAFMALRAYRRVFVLRDECDSIFAWINGCDLFLSSFYLLACNWLWFSVCLCLSLSSFLLLVCGFRSALSRSRAIVIAWSVYHFVCCFCCVLRVQPSMLCCVLRHSSLLLVAFIYFIFIFLWFYLFRSCFACFSHNVCCYFFFFF